MSTLILNLLEASLEGVSEPLYASLLDGRTISFTDAQQQPRTGHVVAMTEDQTWVYVKSTTAGEGVTWDFKLRWVIMADNLIGMVAYE